MTGKPNTWIKTSLVVATALLSAAASAQIATSEGAAAKEMRAPQVAGDDRIEVRFPNGCQIRSSMTRGCDVIRCKADETIGIKSARGIQTAKSIANLRAKKAMSDFMSEYLSGKEAMNQTREELAKEGVATEAMATTLTTLTTQISSESRRLLVGVAIEEDGITESAAAGQYMAYAIAKTSCRLQAAAGQNAAGMANAANAGGGGAQGGAAPTPANSNIAPAVTQNPNSLNVYQRRGGGLD
jgi:hypothetical protein